MFLLDTLPVPSFLLVLLPILLSAAALLLTLYAHFRTERREDGQTTSQRLRTIDAGQRAMEVGLANQLARQQGFQDEIEKVADHGRRERQAIIDNSKRDHDAMREQIKDLPAVRDVLSRLVERVENFGKTVDKLDGKTDRIVELLTHK